MGIKSVRCTQETVIFNEEEFKGMIDLLNPAQFIVGKRSITSPQLNEN